MSANDRQVGGEHYRTVGEQHWDRQWRIYGRGYFIGCITKYVERYPAKNGVEDLEKAKHFIEKLIELERAAMEPALTEDERFQREIGISRRLERGA
jgi:hypothetical protein